MGSQLTSQQSKSKSPEKGALYIVATPIGNLGDMTYRAVETLQSVDLIACEDTRVSAKLLQHFDIHVPTLSYNDHNGSKQRPKLLEKLASGQNIALISDAGTPLISDPGYKLVEDAHAKHIPVIPIPGASSIITALCACGLPTDQFHFAGFLPTKSKARQDAIASLSGIPSTLVLLESPKRLVSSLADLLNGLGERQAVIARELTKRFEEMRRGSLHELLAQYEQEDTPKGEIVIVIAPAQAPSWNEHDINQLLSSAMKTCSTKEAAAKISQQTGLSKSDLYQRALALK